MKKVAWILVIIGALNWGLVGLGSLMGSNWNLVELIFGSGILASVIYVLVGVSAIVSLKGCSCCKNGTCSAQSTPKTM